MTQLLVGLQCSMLESLAQEQTRLSTELMIDALEEAWAVYNFELIVE